MSLERDIKAMDNSHRVSYHTLANAVMNKILRDLGSISGDLQKNAEINRTNAGNTIQINISTETRPGVEDKVRQYFNSIKNPSNLLSGIEPE
jgi:hypothetical protein